MCLVPPLLALHLPRGSLPSRARAATVVPQLAEHAGRPRSPSHCPLQPWECHSLSLNHPTQGGNHPGPPSASLSLWPSLLPAPTLFETFSGIPEIIFLTFWNERSLTSIHHFKWRWRFGLKSFSLLPVTQPSTGMAVLMQVKMTLQEAHPAEINTPAPSPASADIRICASSDSSLHTGLMGGGRGVLLSPKRRSSTCDSLQLIFFLTQTSFSQTGESHRNFKVGRTEGKIYDYKLTLHGQDIS